MTAFYTIDLKGILPDHGHLFLWYHVWPSRGEYEAGMPPTLSNSHIIALPNDGRMDQTILQLIREYIARATQAGITGDQIDYVTPFVPLDTSSPYFDPLITALHGKGVAISGNL